MCIDMNNYKKTVSLRVLPILSHCNTHCNKFCMVPMIFVELMCDYQLIELRVCTKTPHFYVKSMLLFHTIAWH